MYVATCHGYIQQQKPRVAQRQILTFLRTPSWGDVTEPDLQARVIQAVASSLSRSHTECLKGFQGLVSFYFYLISERIHTHDF